MNLSDWFTGIDSSQWATPANPGFTLGHIKLMVVIAIILLAYQRVITLRDKGEL